MPSADFFLECLRSHHVPAAPPTMRSCNTNPLPISPPTNDPSPTVPELIHDMCALTKKLDSFTLSFSLAWQRFASEPRPQQPPDPARNTP